MANAMSLVVVLLLILDWAQSFLQVTPSPIRCHIRPASSHTTLSGRRSFGAFKGMVSSPKIVTTKKIDFSNFWLRSVANFTRVSTNSTDSITRPPDFESWSGSLYWDEGDRVIRRSDHWTGRFGVGPIRECLWYLIDDDRPIPNIDVLAFCRYDHFQMIKKKSMKKRKKWSTRKS